MTRLDGADLSHYQATIDWPALRAATWWCATKATQGTTSVDPTFAEHWAQMRAQGFTHRLAYHWLDPVSDPVVQAQHFLSVVGELRAGEGTMLDAEQGGITVERSIVWCETVEAVTHRPCSVYSGVYVAGGTIWRSVNMRSSKYGRRPMHLAAYTTLAKAVALVKGDLWDAWQYSSDGPVPGVVGRCDMNEIASITAYDLACGLVVRPPVPAPPTEDDMAITIFELTDSPAVFLAYTSPQGAAIECRWSGPGDANGDNAVLTYHRNAGALVQRFTKDILKNISLVGPMPPGFTAADFANTVDPTSVDQTARDGVATLNASVARVGQDLADVKMNLAKAGGN